MEHVLVLDPAASCGYCLMHIDSEADTANIYEEGFIDIDTSSNYQGDHCIDLMTQLAILMERIGPSDPITHVVIEDYFFSNKFRTGSNVNPAYRTAIHIFTRLRKLPYTIVNITSWKTFVAGKSIPTREQKKMWGANVAKKLYIQEALWKRYDIKFPNHSISKKTGKPIKFRTDIVDVVGQAIYYAQMISHIRTITRSVQCSPDIIYKRTPKGIFEYS